MDARFSRRTALAAAAGMPVALRGASANWLLTDEQGVAAARARAETQPWAKAALEEILQNARRGLESSLQLPDRGGQWPHWYSCERDGVKLETVSPTEHRCPKCGTVYRGEPYDSVVLYGVHSRYSRFIRDLGLAFRFTGERAYARKAAGILAAYAAAYSRYKRHNIRGEDKVGGGRIMAQTLDESVWLIPVAWGYSLVKETIAPAQRTRIEIDLLIAATELIREHRMGIHNIQCWKNSAVGCAGYAAGRDELVADAIDNPDRGFRVQIARGVTDDGLWYEGSLGYHAYTMEALWPLAEAARRAGTDLYSARMRSLWDAPIALALPNGDPPGFNDSGGGNLAGLAPLYELGYARWQSPAFGRVAARSKRTSPQALLYGAETLPEGPLVPEESRILRAAGFALLRARGTVAAMRFGMHGGGHGHPDKLNIVTWGAGKLWGLDPGSINYGVPLHHEWYRSTIAHNTVCVDGALQAATDGLLEDWKSGQDATSIQATAANVYAGVKLTRSVTVRANRMDDRFECVSEGSHTYDWAFHAAGRLTTSVELAGKARPGDANGYQHISAVASGAASGDWWARWEADGASFTLRVKAAEGTEVFTGVGPGKNPADAVAVLIIRRRGKTAAFEVAHEFASA